MSKRLSVAICGVEFNNPLIAASGTFGYGLEFVPIYDLSKIGGISVKGISLHETDGNPMPRIRETHSGMLNAIGLQNIGVQRFLDEKLRILTGMTAEHPDITVTFFQPDEKKDGGAYVDVAGVLKRIEEYERTIVLMSGERIAIEDVLDIASEVFEGLI